MSSGIGPDEVLFSGDSGGGYNIEVMPGKITGFSQTFKLFEIGSGVLRKDPSLFLIWDRSDGEKGTWTLTIPAAPVTFQNGHLGTGVEVEGAEVGEGQGLEMVPE